MPAGRNSTTTTPLPPPDHLPKKSLEIKQDDKFFTRLLSKETSIANPSFRVYYGVASAGAVPFMWESQPGTPKHKLCDTYIPPLTPPPSYHSKFKNNKKPSSKKSSKPNLTNTVISIFPKLAVIRRRHVSPSPSSPLSSSSWSTSSLLSPSSSSKTSNFHRRRSSSLSSFESRVAAEEEGAGAGLGSPTSTLCFGVGREKAGEFRGCYSLAIVKNALSSIIGHGSGQGVA